MRLTIDNLDSAGVRDYTDAIDRDMPVRVHRVLNGGATLQVSLWLREPSLVVPANGGRLRLVRDDGTALFDGVVRDEPDYEFLGWGERGPMYRLGISAASDEVLLDRQVLPRARVLNGVSAGEALRQITDDVAGAEVDCSGVEDLDDVLGFEVDWRQPWSWHAQRLANQARAACRFEDGKLVLEPLGTRTHAIREDAATFSPDALKVRVLPPAAGDVTVVGHEECREYVKDYRFSDGVERSFLLSRAPMADAARTVMEEAFLGDALDPLAWRIQDPTAALDCAGGSLVVNGGSGMDGETTAALIEKLEMSGALVCEHGTMSVEGTSQGILGGLYAGTITQAGCIAGFLVSTSAGTTTIAALINGIARGVPVTTEPGKRYAMRTRVYSAEQSRAEPCLHSSLHPAGAALGGGLTAAPVRVVLEVGSIDPVHEATPAWSVLYDDVLLGVPAFATYALVNAAAMQVTLALTRIRRGAEVEARRAPPGEEFRTVALGPQVEGNEADLQPGPAVEFYAEDAPRAEERLVFRYRGRGVAAARVAASGDGRSRAAVCSVNAPPLRTSADSRLAALALLEEACLTRYSGEYSAWSEVLDGDVWPGDEIAADVPSRTAAFSVIVREVWIDPADLESDRSRYRIRFANDAAEPIAIATAAARVESQAVAAEDVAGPALAIAPLPEAEIVSFGVGVVTIDAGTAPPDGGGFEVRRSDAGWGPGTPANLVGRFTTQQFTVERASRVAEFALRAYDGAAPPRYSRVSTILHVNYPV